MKFVQYMGILGCCLLSVACNSGKTSANTITDGSGEPLPAPVNQSVAPPQLINNLPELYQNLPDLNGSSQFSAKLAYAQNGEVGALQNTGLKSSLSSMAVALSYSNGLRYCTGTPIYKNGNIVFILTAAHCVVGGRKEAGVTVTANNIITFANSMGYVNQTTNAYAGSETSGVIKAIYLPQSYCTIPEFIADDNGNYYCSQLELQNGDIALLKVQSNQITVNNQLQLPESDLNIQSGTLMLTLSYGITNFAAKTSNTKLYYVNYENFATNEYQDIASQRTLLNGYNPVTPNVYYSIICGGDSGGGDFYWNGKNWEIVGVHSFGTSVCGGSGTDYWDAFDASGDVRPFTLQLQSIIANDTSASGCASNANDNGFICKSQ